MPILAILLTLITLDPADVRVGGRACYQLFDVLQGLVVCSSAPQNFRVCALLCFVYFSFSIDSHVFSLLLFKTPSSTHRRRVMVVTTHLSVPLDRGGKISPVITIIAPSAHSYTHACTHAHSTQSRIYTIISLIPCTFVSCRKLHRLQDIA
jgi:hypothetical protein